MKVSDKDFDQLFNSKLGDMEMEPSANVWNNIADELDGKKEEVKAGLPFMKIAAGIVLLMAVGLFFIRPEHQTIALQPVFKTIDSQGERVTAPVKPSVDYTESPVIAETQTPVKHQQSKTVVEHIASQMAKQVDTVKNSTQYIAAVDQQSDNSFRITQAAAIKNQNANLVPETIISNQIKSTNVLPKNTNPLMASANDTKAEPAKKHKIHSLGDLLNVVIAKVDKREDKLIEFTNTSDDDSFNVTGVNLGLLKAKKEK